VWLLCAPFTHPVVASLCSGWSALSFAAEKAGGKQTDRKE
jgi:hypothetical protein